MGRRRSFAFFAASCRSRIVPSDRDAQKQPQQDDRNHDDRGDHHKLPTNGDGLIRAVAFARSATFRSRRNLGTQVSIKVYVHADDAILILIFDVSHIRISDDYLSSDARCTGTPRHRPAPTRRCSGSFAANGPENGSVWRASTRRRRHLGQGHPRA